MWRCVTTPWSRLWFSHCPADQQTWWRCFFLWWGSRPSHQGPPAETHVCPVNMRVTETLTEFKMKRHVLTGPISSRVFVRDVRNRLQFWQLSSIKECSVPATLIRAQSHVLTCFSVSRNSTRLGESPWQAPWRQHVGSFFVCSGLKPSPPGLWQLCKDNEHRTHMLVSAASQTKGAFHCRSLPRRAIYRNLYGA